MSDDLTAEQLAQRIYDCRLLENRDIDKALARAGGRGVATLDEFVRTLLQTELMTNWQIARVMEKHTRGYFYGNWKILYLVGAGTFARVYRAVNRKNSDNQALKVLRNRYSNDENTRERFMREARMVMKLRHPNIVPIHEVDNDRTRSYMVMDFVEGQNLRDYVRAHKKLKIIVALRIIRDLAAGLAYAAEFNITHRDMKLSNVLLSSKGQAKLVDFGLATMRNDDDEQAAGEFNPRSIDYAGLEKTTNVQRDDKRSDIYFLGCMLYNMVTGVPPLLETRERMRRMSASRYREVVPVTNHEPSLPHRVVILINRLMDLEPEKRIQTPALALREIEIVLSAVEAGDIRVYDKKLQEQHAAEYSAMVGQNMDGGCDHTVMLVESNIKVQDSLRKKLKKLGYRVLIMGDPKRAIQRFEYLDPAERLPAECVIFSCTDLGKNALAAFNEFGESENTSHIPSILMVTVPQQKFLDSAKLADHRVHLPLPVKFKRVRQTLRQLLGIAEPTNGSSPKSSSPDNSSSADSSSNDDTDVDGTDVDE